MAPIYAIETSNQLAKLTMPLQSYVVFVLVIGISIENEQLHNKALIAAKTWASNNPKRVNKNIKVWTLLSLKLIKFKLSFIR